jgi:acyl-CoA thioesterase-1
MENRNVRGCRSLARRRGRRSLVFGAPAALAAALTAPAAATTRPRLLVLGDSLTAGYGLPAAQAFPARLQVALDADGARVEVINGGVSGDTSAGGLARLDWLLGDGPKPGYAIVALGANDALRGLSPERMEENLDRIVERFQQAGARVLLAGMRAPPNLGREYAERFAAVFARIAERRRVALYPFFLDGVAGDPGLNLPDGIHPNPAGVDAMVARILPAVRRLVAE